MPKLKNPKHEMFCKEYIKDLNASKAYLRAGYSNNGANCASSKLFAKDNIRQRIMELKDKRSEKLEITTDDVLRKLQKWVDSDLTEFMTLTPTQIKKLDKDLKKLITYFKHSKTTIEGIENETIELKFVSKEKAQDWINRHIGFYEKDNKTDDVNVIGFEFTEATK